MHRQYIPQKVQVDHTYPARMTDYLGLLSDLSEKQSPAIVLQSEVQILSRIVSDVAKHIRQRQALQQRHAAFLMTRQLSLESQLLNISEVSNRKGELEGLLESLKSEQINVEAGVQRDVLELKKSLWHYSLLLYKKQVQARFLK